MCFPPLDFLLHGLGHHLADDQCFIVDIREFFLDFSNEIGKNGDVSQFIAPNIGNHATGREHFHMINRECVEEGKTIVEVDGLKEEIGYDAPEKGLSDG
jgi:hypothetical protein